MDEMAAKRMRDTEECIQREVEAKLQQKQATTHQQTDEIRTAIEDIEAKLDQLMKQLNEYRPAQEATVTAQGERLSIGVERGWSCNLRTWTVLLNLYKRRVKNSKAPLIHCRQS